MKFNYSSEWIKFRQFYPKLIFSFAIISFTLNSLGQDFTKGIGIYPGDPGEDFSPLLQTDTVYRNIALRRPAYHSSSYDYNLTAQLINDGIKDTTLPSWIATSSSQSGLIKKDEREFILDRHQGSAINLDGTSGWVQIEICGGNNIPDVDSIVVSGSIVINDIEAKGWNCTVSGSEDGKTWNELGNSSGMGMPGDLIPEIYRKYVPKNFRRFHYPFNFQKKVHYRFYKSELTSQNVTSWHVAGLDFFNQKKQVEIGGPYKFTSAWMSAGNKEEWVYIDLSAICTFDQINLYWIRKAAKGIIQSSNDAVYWNDIKTLPENKGLTDKILLEKPVKGRYVRLLLTQPVSNIGYILSEMEVFGRGGIIAIPHATPSLKDNGRFDLAGGNWRVQRESLVNTKGEILSQAGFNDKDWIVGTVPGTVLVSYLNAGVLPDPNYSDNQLMISESFFYSDFWYRNEFEAPASYNGKNVFLNFDGINWKAEIYLNGQKLGNIDGAFIRSKFDITSSIIAGKKNTLAVHIIKNATPGFVTEQTRTNPDANGGELGADNPTFHASVGWDWIPTIRGRNTGIWKDVYLTANNSVTLSEPYIKTEIPLPDTSNANVSVEVVLQNNEMNKVEGTLRGKFGEIPFEQAISLMPKEKRKVTLDSKSNPALHITNPKLWWPNGYGQQNLYNVEFTFVSKDNQVSDKISCNTGIRKMTYSEDGGVLKIWVNGRRFIGRGGNWGFPESMLRYRKREYDIAVRYHKEINFTMIRNWVGQTGDEEFFDACDKYGIMVWQDFWLANPVDGPNPNDPNMFIQNAEDFVKHLRNHPSIGLYCGRNEGNPPDVIDTSLRKMISKLNPEIHYISNSASGVVSGGGPYWAMPDKFYFEKRATTKLHSELGMPCIMTIESMKQMLPDSLLWPQSSVWGLHDFCLDGAMKGSSFNQMMDKHFGNFDNAKDWLQYAQLINYEGYRAMFEAQGKNRMGMLLWMSHPSWPSLVWQTYDYYFEPTAAYFGCKKASEPLHIQWNASSDSIEVVNYSTPKGSKLTAEVEIFNLDGSLQWKKDTSIDCHEDHIVHCFKEGHPAGLSNVYFLKLKLLQAGKTISENFYFRGLEEDNYKAIRELTKAVVSNETKVSKDGNHWYLNTTLENSTKFPALFLRLKVLREKSNDRILPVYFSDNYVSLMPGEKRVIQIELEDADTRGEKPKVEIEGLTP